MKRLTAPVSAALQKDGVVHLVIEFDPSSDGWFLYGHTDLNAAPSLELWHMNEDDAMAQASADWGVERHNWIGGGDSADVPTRDSNGTALKDGDSVALIKDLPVKGAGVTIKRGTTVKNISLTGNPEEIDCRTKEVKNLVLKSCFVKKL